MEISVIIQNVPFRYYRKRLLKSWIISTIKELKFEIGSINVIITSDEELLIFNQKYLGKNEFTDVIAFDYTESESISGDIYVSIDRVRDNTQKYQTTIIDELERVIIHGVLHLCGYSDDTDVEKDRMTKIENYFMLKRPDLK